MTRYPNADAWFFPLQQRQEPPETTPIIKSIVHLGKFIDDTRVPGERRQDGIAPAHGNGVQLSRNRFLTLVSTLGFRGVDDNRI